MNKIDEFFKLKRMTGEDRKAHRKRETYKCPIKAFFRIIDKDMDKYFHKDQTYEQDLRKFWEWVGTKATTTQNSYMAMLKSFLIRFDKKGIKDLDIWDDVSITLKGKRKPNYEKHVPTHEEMQRILNYCDIRTKTAIMLSLSSGIRMESVVGLLPEDIDLNYKPVSKIYVRSEIAKEGNAYTTFCSLETTKLLKEWIRVREEYVLKSYKTLRFDYADDLIKNFKSGNDRRIFPFHDVPIRDAFNKACEKAGFKSKTKIKDETDTKSKRFQNRSRRKITFHCLRAFFETYLGDWYLAKKLMGHSLYMSTYDKKPAQLLAGEYFKHMDNLTIFERSPDLTDINQELQEKDKQIKDLNEKLNDLRLDMIELQIKLGKEKEKK